MKKTILCLSVTILLAGCGVYGRYERPDSITADGLYRDSTSAAADTVSAAAIPWRQLFTDTRLQELIAAALGNNTDLGIARMKVAEAQASLTAARLAYLPSLSVGADGAIRSFDGAVSRTYNIGATAGWEADVFGRLTTARRGAAATLEAQKDYVRAVTTQLVATVAGCYYTLLMLDEQLAISRRTLDTWGESVRTMEALMRAGQTDETAVLQARANRMTVEASVLALERSVSETENSLSALLAMPSQHIGRGTLSDQHFPEELAVGLPVALLSNRPDVRQAEHELAAAFYATSNARASFYPSITLSGTAGWTNSGGSGITNPGKWLLTALGSLTQPLFQRGKLTAELKAAQARQEEARLTFRQALLDAGKEVNDALTQWQTADRTLAISDERVKTLQEAARKTQLLMKHSSATYLEVLTAQQSLLNAELTRAQNRYERIDAIINLYRALGGGAE
ncbi:MAG: efflux transporter outer membrane subunit [Prevotella sp.]